MTIPTTALTVCIFYRTFVSPHIYNSHALLKIFICMSSETNGSFQKMLKDAFELQIHNINPLPIIL